LQQPSTTTATTSATPIQHQNETPIFSREDQERLQHLSQSVKQLYTDGKLVLPGKGPRNGSQEQQMAPTQIIELSGTPEPQPPADHIQPQCPATPSAPGIKKPANSISPVRQHHPDYFLLPISLHFLLLLFYQYNKLSQEQFR